MVERRPLTQRFVDDVSLLDKSERWIADTSLRGFGLRIWATPNGIGKAFALRSTNKAGKPVRKTFRLPRDYLPFCWSFGYDSPEPSGLGDYLEYARLWAAKELDKLKGRALDDDELEALDWEYSRPRKVARKRLASHRLDYAVNLVLDRAAARGWTESYTDRLRVAFDGFANSEQIRSLTIGELAKEGSFAKLVERQRPTRSNQRLLRSLFDVVFWNIRIVGGPWVLTPQNSYGLYVDWAYEKPANDWLSSLQASDFGRLLSDIEKSNLHWCPKGYFMLALYFRAPLSSILRADWNQIVDEKWFPYRPHQQVGWFDKACNIHQREFEWIEFVYENALKDCVTSPYLFPNSMNPRKPVKNLDRQWFRFLAQNGWPMHTLSAYRTQFHDISHRFYYHFGYRNDIIKAKLSMFPHFATSTS